MTKDALIAAFAALGVFALALSKEVTASITGRLTEAQVRDMAARIGGQMGVDPLMIRAIVEIESARDPNAFRAEPHIGDASVGLMQTLLGTAQWVWDINAGGVRRGVPRRPAGYDELRNAERSMWLGTGYLAYLSAYKGLGRMEEWIVRAYNGGPGGATKTYTEGYWSKYLAAKQRLSS